MRKPSRCRPHHCRRMRPPWPCCSRNRTSAGYWAPRRHACVDQDAQSYQHCRPACFHLWISTAKHWSTAWWQPIATAIRLSARELVVLPWLRLRRQVSGAKCARTYHACDQFIWCASGQTGFERYSTSAAIHIVPPLCPQEQSSYDYSRGAHLIVRARDSTRQWIDDGGLARCEFPDQLQSHSHQTHAIA